jgi:hypothetical protein
MVVNKNTRTMKLTDTQKKYLADNTCSDKEEDFKAIEQAIDAMAYAVYIRPRGCDRSVPPQFDHHAGETEVRQILGEEAWLDGCERAAFHRTAVRYANGYDTEVRFDYVSFFRRNGINPRTKINYDKHNGVLSVG